MSRKRTSRSEQVADEVLAAAGVVEPPIDVEAIARKMGAAVNYVPAPDAVSGMLSREQNRIVIGVNSNHHPNRQRFTIAHEMGHWRLHLGDQLSLFVDESMVYFRDEVSSQAVDPKEIQANAFAAALLMPRRFLLDDLAGLRVDVYDDREIERLAKRYRVSVQALAVRLGSLGLVAGLPVGG